MVSFGGRPVPLPENEILQLEKAVMEGVAATPHPYLTVGDRVRIKRGPLAGLTGILLRDTREMRVVLTVEMIARSISVEIELVNLEAV